MEESFKFEIVSPEKIFFSNTVNMVTIPSYEGEMSLLKNHISIITFLRPGIIKVKKNEGNNEEFFVQDGTVEYFNDNLIILSTSVLNIKDFSKEYLDKLNEITQEQLTQKNITDHERYILNHKLEALKEIRI